LLTPDVAGVVHLLGVIPASILVFWVWEDRRNPGVKWFILAMVAAALWSVLFGLMTALDSVVLTLTFHNLYLFTMHVTAACWFLLAYEWSYRTTLPNRALGVLLVVPLGLQVISVVRPSLMFVRTVDANGLIQTSYGVAFILGQLVYGYLPIVVGASLWVGEAIAADGKRRRQALTLLVASLIAFGVTVIDLVGQYNDFLLDIDLIAFGLYASGALIAYSITRHSLLQVGMEARKVIANEIDDALILLNSDQRIVDLNPAAVRLFDFSTNPVGRPVSDALTDYPSVLESISRARNGPISFESDGVERHFALSVSPVEYGRGLRRKAVILRNITQLRNREEDLDRLANLLSRVFRHNIRNDLVPIREYAELIRQRSSGEIAHFSERIIAKSNRLSTQAEKARLIERVIETRECMRIDLADAVERVVSPYRTDLPDVHIETDVPAGAVVDAHPQLPRAVGELIENAIEHSVDPVHCEIEAEVDDDTVLLWVTDDGPGIPGVELDVLQRGIQTDLRHGRGVGLWLVRWIIDRSNGSIHTDATDAGTRVCLELNAASEA